MITDHKYKPCYYDTDAYRHNMAIAIGLCVCPYGVDRCHVKGCGKKESEHKESERIVEKDW